MLGCFFDNAFDLVKTKLMMQSTSAGGQYSGVFDVFKSLYETQGVGGPLLV